LSRWCGRIEWIVLDSSKPAIQFYRSLEASPLADWRIFRLADGPLARFAKRSKSRPEES
jgi:hypothetical protein